MRHPILNIYVRWFTWAPRLMRWTQHHPRISSAILITGLLVLGFIFDTITARAADDTTIDSAPPYLATLMGTDDEGVPLAAYASLPLDYSDALHPLRALPGILVSIIWSVHIFAIAWILTFLDWLISFEWVSWLGTPIEALAEILQTKLSAIGWVPMALAVAALVAGVVIFRGKFGTGIIDLGISLMSAILVAGALANPITSLTAENGGLDTVQSWGKELMTDFFVDEDEQPPSSDENKDNVIAEEITQPLASLFIRQPAQSIAFGHTLTGECDEVFTEQMKTSSPIAGGEDTVRDKVADCDPVAKVYVFNPNFGQVITAVVSLGGVAGVLMIAEILAVLLVGSILMTFWDGMKAMGSAYIAVLPAVGRYTLWKSIMGLLFGLGSIVLFLILIGGFLKLVVEVMSFVGAAGIPITTQLGFISFTFFIMLALLLWTWYKVRKSSEGTAAWLSKFGLGTGSRPAASGFGKAAVAVAGFRAATNLLGDSARRPQSDDAPKGNEPSGKPSPVPAMQSSSAGTPGLGPNGDSSSAPGVGKSMARIQTAGSAVRIAKAGSGGPGGMAAVAAMEVGKQIAQKKRKGSQQESASLRAAQIHQAPAARWDRRISVDSDGIGHIRRSEAEPIVFTATPSRDRDRSVRNRELRQTLIRGAIERGAGART